MHVLDNMVWNALNSGNHDLGFIDGNSCWYKPSISPFAGMKDNSPEDFERLYHALPKGQTIALKDNQHLAIDNNKWKAVYYYDCYQFVYTGPSQLPAIPFPGEIKPLNESHTDQMIFLTALTKPGPFREETYLFGNYFGIFDNEQLVAMAGQRLHPEPYLEVSAVCTHPDHRGKGYAKVLMLHVMKLILERSYIPFLHVATSNSSAIHLYESIGYEKRIRTRIEVLEKL